jgi:hypothetical protein
MRKLIFFMVLGVALSLMWLPGVVADANASITVTIESYDSNVYPGDIWDATIKVYNWS